MASASLVSVITDQCVASECVLCGECVAGKCANIDGCLSCHVSAAVAGGPRGTSLISVMAACHVPAAVGGRPKRDKKAPTKYRQHVEERVSRAAAALEEEKEEGEAEGDNFFVQYILDYKREGGTDMFLVKWCGWRGGGGQGPTQEYTHTHTHTHTHVHEHTHTRKHACTHTQKKHKHKHMCPPPQVVLQG